VSPLAKDGQVFREELLKQWKANSGQFYTDFSELCNSNFVGLTSKDAQQKMEGAGQVFAFQLLQPQPTLTPPGTVAMIGGLGLGSTIISNASFNIVLYVDTQEAIDSQVVRRVTCGIRSVSL
jgi:hypothetical protein